jgi:hypothetical protein
VTDLLADAVAELYEADPDGFMPRRQELAEAARAAGEPGAAKQIAALRKPTRSAWLVNHLVRTDPGVTSRLTALATELRDAEHALDGARIRELTTARSRLVDELTRQAVSGQSAPAAGLREEVSATLDAALADPEVASRLGTLVRAEHWAGFGLPADGASAPPAPPAAPSKPARPAPPEPRAEQQRRRREKIREAERAVAEATRAAKAATRAEQRLDDTVRRLEAELAEAREQLADARRQSYRAESRQRRASEALGRLRP